MLVEGPMPVVVLLDAIMHHLQVCFSNPSFHFQGGSFRLVLHTTGYSYFDLVFLNPEGMGGEPRSRASPWVFWEEREEKDSQGNPEKEPTWCS